MWPIKIQSISDFSSSGMLKACSSSFKFLLIFNQSIIIIVQTKATTIFYRSFNENAYVYFNRTFKKVISSELQTRKQYLRTKGNVKQKQAFFLFTIKIVI